MFAFSPPYIRGIRRPIYKTEMYGHKLEEFLRTKDYVKKNDHTYLEV